MCHRWMLPVVLLLTVPAPGCGSDDPTPSSSQTPNPGDTPTDMEGTPTAGNETASATETPDDGTPTQTAVTSEVSVAAILIDQDLLGPIEGASICLNVDDGPCTTSDADGKVTLSQVPTNSQVTLKVSGIEKYPVTLLSATTGEENLSLGSTDGIAAGVKLTSNQLLELIAVEAETTLNEKMGIIKVLAVGVDGSSVGVKGLQFTMSAGAGIGPIYLDESGTPDDKLGSTSDNGAAYWINAEPGAFTFSVKASDIECHQTGGAWDGAEVGLFDLSVEEAIVTLSAIVCE